MKKTKSLLSYFVSLILISAPVLASDFDPAVKAAHQAYLAKDGESLITNTREALVKHANHPLIVQNLMSLYRQAQGQGFLTNARVGWNLPAELPYLKIEIQRRYLAERNRVFNFLTVSGMLKKDESIEQFQLIRYPTQVVLDKKNGIGDWVDGTWEGKPSFWAAGEKVQKPIEQGLYLVNIQIRNHPMVQGWVLMSQENSSASPSILAPTVKESVAVSQPSIQWRRFISPEYREGEVRRLNVKVSDAATPEEKQVMSADLDPDQTNFRVGDVSSALEYEGAETLPNGTYYVLVSYQERTRFGDVVIGRGSTTKVPFSVTSKRTK